MIPQSELITEFGIGGEEKDRNESLSENLIQRKAECNSVPFLLSDSSAAESAAPLFTQTVPSVEGPVLRTMWSSLLLGAALSWVHFRVINTTEVFQHYLFSNHSQIDAFPCMFSVCDLFLMHFASALAALWQPENRAVYWVHSCC